MRAVVLMFAIAVQILAGFGLMHFLDDFMDGGKLCYYRWAEDNNPNNTDDDAYPSKSQTQVIDQKENKKSSATPRTKRKQGAL
jgi:hypothetical protein